MLRSTSRNAETDIFTQLTQETWEAIQAIRRKWPGEIDWSEVRRTIEEAGREFSEIENLREQRRRSVEYKAALETAQRTLGSLKVKLLQLESLSPSGKDLDGLPDPDLKLHEARLDQLSAEYEKWSTPFGGRNNRNRERLENRLLSIWEEQLHGRLGSSLNKFDEPIGPLIRFLKLTLTAITGTRLGPHGIRSIIDKAKKRRRRGSSKERKPVARPLRRQGQKN
ncbi:hypothetical protein [Bradyrhizobium sp. CW1]|uniref:hypothetical protein n=1 Tax=Bradyrhizobium sp. CW1 TaxID=2782686 RepID=UPI001FFF6E8D|nr:hypothetical protein [Bradyrhizobium sp. CW1]UPJ25395.1 hypothetical protein IVB54_26500 [Bradyrhizobium sp. CW1]